MDTDKVLVVLGLDSEKKPHAARFKLVHEAAVRKAAAAKNFQVGVAKTPEAIQIAGNLIEGKLFDSGRGLVPFIKQDAYEKLLKLLDITEVAAPVEKATKPIIPSKGVPSDPYAAIKVGSVILVRDPEPGPERGWWECVVQTLNGQNLVVRYQNYPKLKQFTVARNKIALLPPKA